MGLNLCLYRQNPSKAHPEWDDSKFAVDKEIVVKLWDGTLPLQEVTWDPWTMEEPPRRPVDIKEWKRKVPDLKSINDEDTEFLQERVSLMIELLEKDPEYGVFISQ